MYICKDCGTLFNTPVEYTEKHGLDSPPYETWYGCPECSGAYTNTFECDVCNKYIIGEYAKVTNGMKICDACFTNNNIMED